MQIETQSCLCLVSGIDLILGKWECGLHWQFFIRLWIFLGSLGFDLAEGCYVAAQGDGKEMAGL